MINSRILFVGFFSSRLRDSYTSRVEASRKMEDQAEEEAARNSVESLTPRLAHRNANFPYRPFGGWVTEEFHTCTTRGEHPFLTSGSVDITAVLPRADRLERRHELHVRVSFLFGKELWRSLFLRQKEGEEVIFSSDHLAELNIW